MIVYRGKDSDARIKICRGKEGWAQRKDQAKSPPEAYPG